MLIEVILCVQQALSYILVPFPSIEPPHYLERTQRLILSVGIAPRSHVSFATVGVFHTLNNEG